MESWDSVYERERENVGKKNRGRFTDIYVLCKSVTPRFCFMKQLLIAKENVLCLGLKNSGKSSLCKFLISQTLPDSFQASTY